MVSKNKKFYFSCLVLFCLTFVFSAQAVFAGVAKLTWTANSETDLTGYKVYYGATPRTAATPGTNKGGYSTMVDAGKVVTYTINNIADTGTTYFSITAYNSAGESSFSSEVKKTPGDIHKDGSVNMLDFGVLVTNYNNNTCDNVADINVDCSVNMLDFQKLVLNYGITGQ